MTSPTPTDRQPWADAKPRAWVAMPHPDYETDWCIRQNGWFVATVYDDVDGEPAEVIARRIAAAPQLAADNTRLRAALSAAEKRAADLEALINSPTTDDWFDGVRLEAAHQQERWGTSHDAGKAPLDWFWLIGYLAQKAATSAMASDEFKAKHHTISTAAALLNWHRAISGEANAMRPGIEPPAAALTTPSPADATKEGE